jgi:hypothetical protein
MIRRAPAEVYIRYLLCHPDGYNNEAIKERMQELELFCPINRELDRLRRTYKPPTPFYPYNRKHEPSIRFLKDTGIYSLFYPDRSTKYAMAILQNRKVRSTVEQLLAQNAKPHMIVEILSRRFGFACSVDGVRKYEYFFFSQDSLRHEKQQALDIVMSSWSVASDGDLTAAHVQAEKRAKWDDPRRTALRLPTCAPAQRLIAMQNGYMPKESEYNVAEELTSLMRMLMDHAKLKLIENGPTAAKDANEAVSAMQRLAAIVEQVRKPDELIIEQVQGLAITSDTEKPKTISELTQGNHTLDLQPIGNHDDDDVELDPVQEEEDGAE